MMGHGPPGAVAESRAPAPSAPAGPTDRELLDRFATTRDQEAFASLVHRHGPMVLGVCRRVLRNREDAQDAFQVTFLVLARKAGSVARAELLANWLHGVAYRTATHMRGRAARRAGRERQVAAMSAPPAEYPEERREVLAVLDEELAHLPEMYRTLLVLCYLEGKTHQEAARQIDCPSGSVSCRLARARAMLHGRLRRRGLVLPAALLVTLLIEQRAGAAVSDELARSTASAAAGYADGTPAAVSPDQAVLTDEVIGELADPGRRRWSILLVLLLLLALLSAGALLAAVPAARVWATPASPPAADPHPASPAPTPGCGAAQSRDCPAPGDPCAGK
jgi:RNA polymerase sigma-70 factor (ECF subfamily)